MRIKLYGFFIAVSLLVIGCSSSTPTLVSLQVDGAVSQVYPAFSASTNHYAAHLTEATGTIHITAVAENDTDEIWIDDHRLTPNTPLTLSQVVAESTITVRVINDSGAINRYDLFVLPMDYPEITVTKTDNVAPGLLYLTIAAGTPTFIVALNTDGVPVYYRRTMTAGRAWDFKRHDDGSRSYSDDTEQPNIWGHRTFDRIILDKDWNEIKRVRANDLTQTDFHDFLVLPNGNHLFMSYEGRYQSLEDFGGEPGAFVEDSVVQEVDGNGQTVFEWNSWEKLYYEDKLVSSKTDYAHINSLYLDDDTNFIVSSRGLSQVVKISHKTGEVLWRFGGIKNEFNFINDPYGNLCGQHSAVRAPNGNLLIFDNGLYCYPENPARGQLTRISEYHLDEFHKTAELVWSYSRPGAFAQAAGNVQRLPNGNTLMGWGLGSDLLATEVDSQGNITFEISGKVGDTVAFTYRAFKFQN